MRSLRDLLRRHFWRGETVASVPAAMPAPTGLTVGDWLDRVQQHLGALPAGTIDLVQAHELRRGAHVVTVFSGEIDQRLATQLRDHEARWQDAGADPIRQADVLVRVVDELVRWKTIIQCREAHATGGYYDDAEPHMSWQWTQIIEPIVRDLDFEHVLELAPGHGRNTEFLRLRARTIQLVDVNPSCIEACRGRFGEELDGCRFSYHVTSGNDLSMIGDATVTLAYSFDSMVHFDKLVVRDYVQELARVLRPGGCAFLHHSNLGAVAPNSDWARNVGNRSDMSAALMREYAQAAGLEVRFQRLSGLADGWGQEELDCLTVLERPPAPVQAGGA